jgi:hypothetical protein
MFGRLDLGSEGRTSACTEDCEYPIYCVIIDMNNMIRLMQRPFDLEVVNIQDPGQERWKRKYVYWIPALHLEGKEVAKGRWDGQVVTQALDAWEKAKATEGEQSAAKSTDTPTSSP